MRWLFAQINPLRLQLPEDFFRNLPTTPGVYIMKNKLEEVLYVGKAKNLKARLTSYCSFDHPRKVQRLIKQVTKIEYEVVATEKEALLRENALLRLLRPPFNRQKTNPESYFYLEIVRHGSFVKVAIKRNAEEGQRGNLFGAFKGIGSMSKVMMSLKRTFSVHFEQPFGHLQTDRARFPLTLPFGSEQMAEEALRLISRYLRGISKEPVRICEVCAQKDERPMVCWLLKQDVQILQDFFEGPARRFYRMRKFIDGKSTISAFELDDLIVEDAFSAQAGELETN